MKRGNEPEKLQRSSIETRSLPALTYVLPPIATSRFAHLCRSRPRGSVHSLLPSQLYLDRSHCPRPHASYLAALPSTRAISQTPVFYVAHPFAPFASYALSADLLPYRLRFLMARVGALGAFRRWCWPPRQTKKQEGRRK